MIDVAALIEAQCHRLGWALVHFLWQGTAIALLFACVRHVLRSAKGRYLAGCGAMAAMIAAALVTYAVQQPVATRIAAEEPRGNGMTTHLSAASAQTLPKTAVTIRTATSVTGGQPATLTRIERALPWMVLAWTAGVCLLSLRMMVGWSHARLLKRLGTRPIESVWIERFAALKQRLAVSTAVTLLKSYAVEVPTVIGWLRPVILVPASNLTGLTPAQIEMILAHELAHIRRGDYLVNLLQSMVETVLFYHPAVWWVSRCVRDERENCCDDDAVRVCGSALDYARALAALEELRGVSSAMAVAANGGSLVTRIRRLIGARDERAQGGAAWIALLFAAGLLTCVALAQQETRPAAPTDGNGTPRNKRTSESSDESAQFRTRRFHVDPSSLYRNLAVATGREAPHEIITDLCDFFSDAVDLRTAGRQIVLNDRLGLLVVRATESELAIIEKMLQKLTAPPSQLTIDLRIAEIAEDLASAAVVTGFHGVPLRPGHDQFDTFRTGVLVEAMSDGTISQRDILLTGLSDAIPTQVLSEPQMEVVIRSLQQRAGVDLLTAPRVTTLSRRPAIIKVGGAKYGMPPGSPGNAGASILPPGAPVEVGPSVEIVPKVLADGYAIRLNLTASVKEFLGYGTSPGSDIPKTSLPSFRVRQAITSGTVQDGQTLVFSAGAFADQVVLSNNVPVLGDVPVVGTLFKTRSLKKIRKTLLFLVTPTIIDPAGNRLHPPGNNPPPQAH